MQKDPQIIQKMFDEIALKYDFNNNLMSLGLQKWVKQHCLRIIELQPEFKVLDLCTGTGDIARMIKDKNEQMSVVGVDFSPKMLEIAREKHKNIEFVNADCTNLPFSDSEFDVCVISFGLRNIENYQKALSEIYRVIKMGGVFAHIDFAKTNLLLDRIFDFVVPKLIKIFYRNSSPYKYLIESKQEFFKEDKLIDACQEQKFKFIKSKKYLLGMIAIQVFAK